MTIRRRRRKKNALDTVLGFWEWCKAPHWTWTLAGWAYGLAVIATWMGLHYLFPHMIFLTFLLLGFLMPIFAVVGWFTFQFAEWLVRRIRQTVDAGIPLSVTRMAKDLVSERKKFADHELWWDKTMRVWKVVYEGSSPHLHRMQQTALGDVRAHVNLAALSGNLDIINRIAADGTLAGAMHCQEVTVQPTGKLNRAWVTFHQRPPLERPIPLIDLPVSGPDLISFGVESFGETAAVRYGLSVLTMGETGSGKSKFNWNMFADILRDGRPTQMYVVNPKNTELAVFKNKVGQRIGNIHVMAYVTTTADTLALFKQFVAEMKQRQLRLEAMGLRELETPTEDMPARFVVVDEMNELKEAYRAADSPMVTAISQGRTSLDWVMASVQVAKVAVLGEVRDQFPLRVCFRTATQENAKAGLGLDASVLPPAHRIPRSMPGVGFYVTEEGDVRKFRTAHVTNSQLDDLAKGKLPSGMVTAAKVKHTGPPGYTYVGRDRKGECMYIGKAAGWTVGLITPVGRRRAQHRQRWRDIRWCQEHERVENWWLVHVVDTRLKVQKYPSEAAALIAEKRLIEELNPRFNIQHNGGNLFSNEAMTRRASVRWRVRDAASEYRQWNREHRVARRAVLAAAHQERVARLQEERDRFVQTVTERAA